MRKRNAVLQALHLLKAIDPGVSVNEVIAFLYAAENEGLTVQDMARVSGLTQSPVLGLLEAFLNPDDGRSHVIHLSAQGRELRERLDAIILQSVTIAVHSTSRAA